MTSAAADSATAEEGDTAFTLRKLAGFMMMSVGMFMAILDIQIVSASLSQIQAGLAASADEIVWVQTSYLVAEVVMIPFSGFLARALSPKTLFLWSCAGFTVASALCATATSINAMIIFRCLQGFVGGAMIPMVYSASFLMFGRQRSAKAMVALGMIVTLAPTLGPTFGGWLTDNLSWHWLFLINIVPGILITFGVWAIVDLGDTGDRSLLGRIDAAGLVMMALFLGGIEYVLEEGPRHDWLADRTVFVWSVVAALSGIGFFWRTLTGDEPIVRLGAFRNFNFAASTVLGAVLGFGLYGLTYIFPLYLSRIAQLSSEQIGTTLFLNGLAMVLSAPIVGSLTRVVDPRKLLCFGFMMMALSTWITSHITADWRFGDLFWSQIIRGIGLMTCMVATSASAFTTLRPDQIADAPGLFTLFRNLGGAFGLAMINTTILWRDNLHWSRLAEAINPGRPEIRQRLDLLSDRAAALGAADPDATAIRRIGGQVAQQALVMSYADCFTAMAVLFAAAGILPLMLKRPAVLGEAPAAH